MKTDKREEKKNIWGSTTDDKIIPYEYFKETDEAGGQVLWCIIHVPSMDGLFSL